MPLAPFDLNLRHVRALVAIVEHGSMSAAARAESLSQPALTQGLAKLERQLGVMLFERRANGVRATAAGHEMAIRAAAAGDHLAAATRAAGSRGRRHGFAAPDRLMTGTQLHAFLSLVDAGSFATAAQRTGITAAALHRAVRDLERLCGWPLAERSGRGLMLTPSGRTLARGVHLAAAEISAAIGELSADPGSGVRIAIGAMPLSRALLLPATLAAFMAEGWRASLEVREGSWRELVEPLRDGTIDLMVGALREATPPGLVQEPLFEDRLVIVGRAEHPLRAIPRPSLDDLAGHPWIVGHPGSPLRQHWEQLFADRPALPAAPLECGSVMVIRGVLQDSDLLTLLSPDQVALETANGVLAQFGEPTAGGARTIGLTTRAKWRPTLIQRRLIELLREQVQPRLQEKG